MSVSDPHGAPPQLRILLVEDSDSFAKVLTAQLQQALSVEHRIERVSRLDDAVASIHDHDEDLVILDLNLPDSQGLETLRKLRRDSPDVPIVILSSDESVEQALDAVRDGAQDYLVKGQDSSVQLARSLRFAIERKQRLLAEEELLAARKIQVGLLPQCNPVWSGFDIAGKMFPTKQTAGDYYDFFDPLPVIGEHALGIAVGDVSGHGLGPAMVMAEARTCLHVLSLEQADPAHILKLTNRIIARSRTRHFVSMLFGWLDTQRRSFHYASAGHRGYNLLADGTRENLESTGMVLGIDDSRQYQLAAPVSLAGGDMLLLITDGVNEAYDTGRPVGQREMLGIERTLDVAHRNRNRPAAEIVESLYAAAKDFANGAPTDDITIVVVKVL